VAANKPQKLMIHLKGDVRNDYIRPVKWVQPGVLALKQTTIFRGDAEANYEFTARFDSKTGKFQVTSKKEIAADEDTKE
jgi:hypothetical protein